MDQPPAPAPTPAAAPSPAPEPAAPSPALSPAPAQDKKPVQQDLDDLDQLVSKPAAKPAEKTAAGTQPQPSQTPEPKTIKEFRAVYEQTKAERDKASSEIAELRKQIEEAKKAHVPASEITQLRSELEQLRKNRDELDTELRFSNYTRSKEFKEKYETPLAEAWKQALTDIDGIKAFEGTDRERPATHADIQALMGLPAGQASKVANEAFGSAASVIMEHRKALLDLKSRSEKAIEEYKTKGTEIEAQRAREAQERTSRTLEMFDSTIQSRRQKFPELFQPEEGDTEGNELLNKGDKLVRLAFMGEGLADNLPDDEKSRIVTTAQAEVAIRAQAFGRERRRVIQLQEKVKELEGKLQGFRATEPNPGKPTGNTGRPRNPNQDDGMEDALRKIDEMPGMA